MSLPFRMSLPENHCNHIVKRVKMIDNDNTDSSSRVAVRADRIKTTERMASMKVLIVPMFARATTSGPWSRALAISKALDDAGHEILMGVAPDGNCDPPAGMATFQIPAPSPLGLPGFLSRNMLPALSKLGVVGKVRIKSFEEVLHFAGALDYRYICDSVEPIRKAIRRFSPDAIYSEVNISAILAARIEGVPVFGSSSYTTRKAYASAPKYASGVRRFISEFSLPPINSSLELFDWLERKFIPSTPSLEPVDDPNVVYCGFMKKPVDFDERQRKDLILVYMGNGSVSSKKLERTLTEVFSDSDYSGYKVIVAGSKGKKRIGNIFFEKRAEFSRLFPRTKVFINHGGQNSMMDGISYCVPQIVFPSKAFERNFNAQSLERVGAGINLSAKGLNPDSLREALSAIESNEAYYKDNARSLREGLISLGCTDTIIRTMLDVLDRA